MFLITGSFKMQLFLINRIFQLSAKICIPSIRTFLVMYDSSWYYDDQRDKCDEEQNKTKIQYEYN